MWTSVTDTVTLGPMQTQTYQPGEDPPADRPGDAGARLRKLRKAKGLTGEELAERAHTTATQISRLEQGKRSMSLKWIRVLARALEVPEEELSPIGTPARVVPLRYVVASSFAEDAPRWNEPPDEAIHVPPTIRNHYECFAALVADDSADRLYPKGTILIVRGLAHIEPPLMIGAKVLVAHYATDLRTGDLFEVLAGLLDRSYAGDLAVALRTNNRQLPASVMVRPAPHAAGGMAERFAPAPAAAEPAVSYTPEPTDRAEILGVIIMAMTPE